MPVGPLRLQTIDQGAVDTEAQVQGAPTFSKLRRALLQTSTIAANEDNPAKKREMLRAAMEGTGTGFSDISLAAHNAALNKVSRDIDIANRGAELTYRADISGERQATALASAEKMQGLSLAQAREEAALSRANQFNLVGYQAELNRINKDYVSPAPWAQTTTRLVGNPLIDRPREEASYNVTTGNQWQTAYQNALKNYYASGR